MHSSSHGLQSGIASAALVLMLIAIWLLLRGYHGLLGDGQLYAFQALARIHPQLSHDLYLQNTSQDQFTIFSPAYGWFIEFLGLEPAARFLTLVFTAWLLVAAWEVARILTNRDGTWLAIAFLLIVAGSYGGSGVFTFAEPFLTARLPAEALIVTSLACHLRERKLLAMAMAAAALLIHPLIALPGLLLLICLNVPTCASVIGAIACAITALLIAGAAMRFPWVSDLIPVMDSEWLNVVQERSQFLFLQLWSFRDWELNARPFFYLAFTSLAVQDVRIRRLCVAAAIVGATGLGVALIASALGPVAILVQGQAWRWVWIAVFVSSLLVPAAVLEIWRDKRCGPFCAVLLLAGLTLSAVNGTACVSLAMILWLMRSSITARVGTYLRWVFFALVLAIVAWIAVQSWGIVTPAIHASGGVAAAQLRDALRDIFGLKITVALAVALVWWGIHKSRTLWAPTLLSAVLLALSIFILPVAFKQSRTLASAADVAEFSEWSNAIPPTSTVLITPARDVGTFVWFTLQRPNYLAVNQSAGVVFSRTTALEVQRRSQVLLPVMNPNYRILSSLRAAAGKPKTDAPTRRLTADSLNQICADSQLGFVISTREVGLDPLVHKNTLPWKDWNLYDCRRVRSLASSK
jgi:hypothetical protein